MRPASPPAPSPAAVAMLGATRTAATVKLEFIQFRARAPHGLIIAFEGKDDRGVFFQWIKQINDKLRFESFICKGKKQVLLLKAALDEDLAGLHENVLFFVDRDFDDLRGAQSDSRIFMTAQYSVENYLLDADVLDRVLTMEFECHMHPDVRKTVCVEFARVYEEFLIASSDVNMRIYAARRFGIDIEGGINMKVVDMVNISLTSVSRSAEPVEKLIPLTREPSTSEFDAAQVDFQYLDKARRYRGKFALKFLLIWLEQLSSIRAAAQLWFAPCGPMKAVSLSAITLELLASRSRAPDELREFLAVAPIRASC